MGVAALLSTVPVVDPTAPEARQWVLDELAKAEYSQAKPGLLDQLAEAFLDWISSLQFDGDGGLPNGWVAVLVVLAVVALVVAFVVFGVPRINRRSAASAALFGEDDDRTAALIRKAAERAASEGDYTLAVAEMFRAIARGLSERTVVTVSPGTTARGFARRASTAFPAFEQRFGEAATAFDAVRYLDETGTRKQYDAIAALEADVRAAKPFLQPVAS